LLPARWQSSRATSGVSFVPAGRVISCRVFATSLSATVRDASGVLAKLLNGGHSTIAGRLAGAFRNSGRDRIADDITKTMTAAGYDVRETDPFTDKPSLALPPAKPRLM
jgi:hypothetical protein